MLIVWNKFHHSSAFGLKSSVEPIPETEALSCGFQSPVLSQRMCLPCRLITCIHRKAYSSPISPWSAQLLWSVTKLLPPTSPDSNLTHLRWLLERVSYLEDMRRKKLYRTHFLTWAYWLAVQVYLRVLGWMGLVRVCGGWRGRRWLYLNRSCPFKRGAVRFLYSHPHTCVFQHMQVREPSENKGFSFRH